MNFKNYENGPMDKDVWYFKSASSEYEKIKNDEHRAIIDSRYKVTVYCEDLTGWEYPVCYHNGNSLEEAIEWADKELNRRS